jgi:hypothetical protein
MADFFEDLTGSAGGFMGNVGGYNIGAQPEPMFTTPAAPVQTFSATETGYTPTFDFSSFMPEFPTYTTFGPSGQAQRLSDPLDVPVSNLTQANVPVGTFAGPGAGGFRADLYSAPIGPQNITGTPLAAGVGRGAEQIIPAPTDEAAAPQDKANFLQSLLGKGFSTSDALKILLGLGGGIMGMSAQKKAADEAAAAEAEYKAAAAKAAGQYSQLAYPYLTAGGTALSQALQGSLGPAQLQMFEAGRARAAQAAEKTGGVGAVQTEAGMQQLYQQALQNQQAMALQLLGPGNQLASNAITTELQGTQGGLKLGLDLATQANQASMNMYSAIASMIGGQKPSTQTATS